MAVFRIEKTRDYTVMSNYHLRDMSLSLKAKGLLSLMLSLPENWDYTMKGLARICKDGIDSISGGIRELEAHGYLIRSRVRSANGQLGSIEYTILEQPKAPSPTQEKPIRENPVQANPMLDAPIQENPAQLNKEESSNYPSKFEVLQKVLSRVAGQSRPCQSACLSCARGAGKRKSCTGETTFRTGEDSEKQDGDSGKYRREKAARTGAMTMARNRNVQIIFWVSEAEKSMIEEKMAQAGMTNLSAYLRRIAIDGMIVRLELPELKEMVSLLRYASNNINQIARRMNESGRIYDTDLEQVVQNQEQLWDMANGILTRLAAIK